MSPLLARVQCGVTRRTFTSRYNGNCLVLAELGTAGEQPGDGYPGQGGKNVPSRPWLVTRPGPLFVAHTSRFFLPYHA